jgi:uncharacterized membrane protein YtjA (UPF0391 family)
MNSGLKFLLIVLPAQLLGAVAGYDATKVDKAWWLFQIGIVIFFLALAYGLHRLSTPKKPKFVHSKHRKTYRL